MKTIIFFIVFGFFFEASAVAQKNEYITLESSGEKIASSCYDSGRSARNSFIEQSKINRKMDLLTLMELILCGDISVKKNKYKIFDRLTRIVDVESEGSGQVMEKKRQRKSYKLASDVMAGHEAYSDQLNVVNESIVMMSYYSSEACISELTFVLQRGKWMITKQSSACD